VWHAAQEQRDVQERALGSKEAEGTPWMLVVCDERTKKMLMLIVDALVALECVGCQNQQAKGEILRHVDGAKIN
jgi:hypothetical protein